MVNILSHCLKNGWHRLPLPEILKQLITTALTCNVSCTLPHHELVSSVHLSSNSTTTISAVLASPIPASIPLFVLFVFVRWLGEKELLKHPVTLKALRVVKKRVQFCNAEQIQTMLEFCRNTPGRPYTLLYRAI